MRKMKTGNVDDRQKPFTSEGQLAGESGDSADLSRSGWAKADEKRRGTLLRMVEGEERHTRHWKRS